MSDDFPAFALSEEHQALREAVRALADDKIAPRAADVDCTSEFPWDVYEALVKADFHAVHIPEAYVGAGADAIATAIVIEEVARACASSSLIPAVNKLGTVPLMIAAAEDVKARYLAPVARGEAMFSYALSEPEAGSDAAAMKTKAVRIDSGYVLNGVKRWITNAGVSKYYTVMAVTDPSAGANGISAFVLEDGDPGFTFGAPEHKLGIKGSPTRELYFDDCAIPADRLVGAEGEGFKIALRTLDHTRITIAAQALGIAQGALDYALGYVRERKQFGRAVADFQGLQFMIADMAMKLEAARQLTYAAAARPERAMAGEKIDDLTFFSSACKCLASDVAMSVTTDAVQLLGGYGYVNDYPVERMMRELRGIPSTRRRTAPVAPGPAPGQLPAAGLRQPDQQRGRRVPPDRTRPLHRRVRRARRLHHPAGARPAGHHRAAELGGHGGGSPAHQRAQRDLPAGQRHRQEHRSPAVAEPPHRAGRSGIPAARDPGHLAGRQAGNHPRQASGGSNHVDQRPADGPDRNAAEPAPVPARRAGWHRPERRGPHP